MNLQDYPNLIPSGLSILDCLKKMDEISQKLLIIADGGVFKGVVSIGDIQRAIIANTNLQESSQQILREIITVASDQDSEEEIRELMIRLRTESMPVVAADGRLLRIVYWQELFEEGALPTSRKLDMPVVIMAGGKGTRLKPLTNVVPKPLIPLGEKTMLENIIERFLGFGCDRFFLSLNYKREFVEYYMNSQVDMPISLEYFTEEKPLGTAGSLHLLQGKLNERFIVSNCDILLDQDFVEVVDYHESNKNLLTVISVLKSIKIPYGTLEIGDGGLLQSLSEKPELTFMINSGVYILEPELLDMVPKNEFFHITHLMDKLMKENKRVGVFPVSEKSWIDVGEWKQYFEQMKIKL